MSIVHTEISLKNKADIILAKRGIMKDMDEGIGEATLADGQKAEYPMAGPLEVWWKNRHMVCDALVIPDAPDVLLSALVLEHMDLTVNPKRELVGVHGDKEMHRV
jgi:hypothetical protein